MERIRPIGSKSPTGNSAIVFGGYGVFGSHVARELARNGILVTIAGRDKARAEMAARALGPACRGVAGDVTKLGSCQVALRGQKVAVNCVGPFGRLDTTLLEACLRADCHYADIADHRVYLTRAQTYGKLFQKQGLAALCGCSSLPAISGALALTARAAISAAPQRVRVILFIGNDHSKGLASIRSFVGGLGKPICAPQGILKGFHHREIVTLPEPFGRRAVFALDGSEYDLFPALLGVRSVIVKVGFESRLVTATFAVLALASVHGEGTARLLARVGRWSRRGSSGAVWQTELFFADGSTRRATLLARKDGQRIAALPCAMVAQALCSGTTRASGMLTAYDFLGADALLDRLVAEGCELSTGNNS